MRRRPAALPTALLALALALAACGDGGGAGPGDAGAADAPGGDAAADATAGDAAADAIGGDAAADAEPADADAGPPVPDPPWRPPDAALRLSTASAPLFAPVGISTAGYGQAVGADSPRGPLAEVFQATTRLLQPPRVQVLHLLRGDARLVLVQSDLIAMFRTVEERVLDKVHARTGVDLRGASVLMANHAHNAPGRLYDLVVAAFFADAYDGVIFERQTDALADAVVAALTAPAEPVRAGYATGANAEMHADRRCENPPERDDAFQLLRLDAADGSGTRAVVLGYAMHGTVLGYADGTLGGDAPHVVELKVQEALPGAPPVLFLESWAGDMAPADPRQAYAGGPWPPAAEGAVDRMEALGRSAAETTLALMEAVTWMEDPELRVVSASAPIDYDVLGYASGDFPFEGGGIFCGGGQPACGGGAPDMKGCLPMPEGEAATQARLSAIALGEVTFVTLPGEPVTSLARHLRDEVEPLAPGPVWVLGYAHDYLGYLLLPEDWWAGGYEPSVTFWGPGQGLWLADRAASVARHLLVPGAPLDFAPRAPVPSPPGQGGGYAAAPSAAPPAWVEEPPAVVAAGAVVTARWTGGDPWLDAPEVTLVDAASGAPVLAGGRPVDQRDYRTELRLEVAPSWAAVPAADPPPARTFTWTLRLRTAVHVPAPAQALAGAFALRVRGRALGAGGEIAPYALDGAPFEVTAAP